MYLSSGSPIFSLIPVDSNEPLVLTLYLRGGGGGSTVVSGVIFFNLLDL